MILFRRPLRLAVSLPGENSRAFFHAQTGEDPVLERWVPHPPPWSRRDLRGVDIACSGQAGTPFLHLDLRTPYGEAAEEERVGRAWSEALGPKAEAIPLRGWNVMHLEDTNLGSNHRVFATGGAAGETNPGEAWDQCLPLESALMALGDYAARKSGLSHFQLVLDQGTWIYSLAYRAAQPWHVMRVAAEPESFAGKRLAEHRRQFPEANSAAPCLIPSAGRIRQVCEKHLGLTPMSLDLPEGFFGEASGPNPWHLGLALAALQEENESHNLIPRAMRDKNSTFRLFSTMAKAGFAALLLGGSLPLLEAGRAMAAGRALAKAESEARIHAEAVSAIQSLRRERDSLYASLTGLKTLWNAPLSVDKALGGIAEALPASGALDGFFLKRGIGDRWEAAFRASVGDWNQIRPMQETLQKLPVFAAVEISDQRRDSERGRVLFQGNCVLAEFP